VEAVTGFRDAGRTKNLYGCLLIWQTFWRSVGERYTMVGNEKMSVQFDWDPLIGEIYARTVPPLQKCPLGAKPVNARVFHENLILCNIR
jgi:hypothetical protein